MIIALISSNKFTHSTRRATIVARAQSSRNSEGHYSGRGNVINVINFKINSELGVSTHAQYPKRNELTLSTKIYNTSTKNIIYIYII